MRFDPALAAQAAFHQASANSELSLNWQDAVEAKEIFPSDAARLDLSSGLGYSLHMSYSDRITIDPAKRGGKPCIRGLRITVYDVLEYLASGMSEDDILKDFPDLTRDDIRACLEFAADRERKLVSLPPR